MSLLNNTCTELEPTGSQACHVQRRTGMPGPMPRLKSSATSFWMRTALEPHAAVACDAGLAAPQHWPDCRSRWRCRPSETADTASMPGTAADTMAYLTCQQPHLCAHQQQGKLPPHLPAAPFLCPPPSLCPPAAGQATRPQCTPHLPAGPSLCPVVWQAHQRS